MKVFICVPNDNFNWEKPKAAFLHEADAKEFKQREERRTGNPVEVVELEVQNPYPGYDE